MAKGVSISMGVGRIGGSIGGKSLGMKGSGFGRSIEGRSFSPAIRPTFSSRSFARFNAQVPRMSEGGTTFTTGTRTNFKVVNPASERSFAGSRMLRRSDVLFQKAATRKENRPFSTRNRMQGEQFLSSLQVLNASRQPSEVKSRMPNVKKVRSLEEILGKTKPVRVQKEKPSAFSRRLMDRYKKILARSHVQRVPNTETVSRSLANRIRHIAEQKRLSQNRKVHIPETSRTQPKVTAETYRSVRQPFIPEQTFTETIANPRTSIIEMINNHNQAPVLQTRQRIAQEVQADVFQAQRVREAMRQAGFPIERANAVLKQTLARKGIAENPIVNQQNAVTPETKSTTPKTVTYEKQTDRMKPNYKVVTQGETNTIATNDAQEVIQTIGQPISTKEGSTENPAQSAVLSTVGTAREIVGSAVSLITDEVTRPGIARTPDLALTPEVNEEESVKPQTTGGIQEQQSSKEQTEEMANQEKQVTQESKEATEEEGREENSKEKEQRRQRVVEESIVPAEDESANQARVVNTLQAAGDIFKREMENGRELKVSGAEIVAMRRVGKKKEELSQIIHIFGGEDDGSLREFEDHIKRLRTITPANVVDYVLEASKRNTAVRMSPMRNAKRIATDAEVRKVLKKPVQFKERGSAKDEFTTASNAA